MAETVGLLTDRGWTYEKDGALWLNTTQLLKNKYLAEPARARSRWTSWT